MAPRPCRRRAWSGIVVATRLTPRWIRQPKARRPAVSMLSRRQDSMPNEVGLTLLASGAPSTPPSGTAPGSAVEMSPSVVILDRARWRRTAAQPARCAGSPCSASRAAGLAGVPSAAAAGRNWCTSAAAAGDVLRRAPRSGCPGALMAGSSYSAPGVHRRIVRGDPSSFSPSAVTMTRTSWWRIARVVGAIAGVGQQAGVGVHAGQITVEVSVHVIVVGPADQVVVVTHRAR